MHWRAAVQDVASAAYLDCLPTKREGGTGHTSTSKKLPLSDTLNRVGLSGWPCRVSATTVGEPGKGNPRGDGEPPKKDNLLQEKLLQRNMSLPIDWGAEG